MRTPCAAASAASAAVVSPLPRRITSGSTRGSETRIRAPSRSGERTSPTASAGRPASASAGRSTSSTSTVTVRERRAAGAQDGRVEALQELAGDVEGDVRARLEVRADGADRDAPRLDRSPFSSVHASSARSSGGSAASSASWRRERGDPRLVEPQPVHRPLVEVGGGHIGRVRGQDRVAPLADELGRPRERLRDGLVGERADRAVCGGRLPLDLLPQPAHPVFLSAAAMPAIERSSGGTHASSPSR